MARLSRAVIRGAPASPGTGGDLDGDGDVGLNDLAILAADFACTP